MVSATINRRLGLTGDKGIKAPVDCATTANITLSGEQVIDSFQTNASRVLVKNQIDSTLNGWWDSNTGNWTRCLDANGSQDIAKGTFSTITNGSQQAQIWQVSASNPIVPGTTAMTFILAPTNLTTSSGLISFLQAGIGAVVRWVQDKLRPRVEPEDFGAVGDGATNDAAAINAAITYCTTNKYTLRVPGKTYFLIPANSETDEAGTNLAAILMNSNMFIKADKGGTFKIANNVSTDGAPINFSMFFSNQVLSNISIKGLTIDMNGANNKISPSRGSLVYNHFTCSHLIFSGTPGGIAACGTDVVLDDCTFINTPGVTCVGMMQSNTVGVTLGKRWTITGCKFHNNGLDSDDHSSVYGWTDHVTAIGNKFGADTMQGTVGNTGGIAAYECHGANHVIEGNDISNYYQGLWVAGNYTSATKNVAIGNNTIGPVRGIGIDFQPEKNAVFLGNINIDSNTFEITDDSTAITLKACVQIDCQYAVTGVKISNNIAMKSGTSVASCFANLGTQTTANNAHSGISLDNNEATGFTFGTFLSANPTNGLGDISIKGDKYLNLTGAGAFASPMGIIAANNTGTIKSLALSDIEVLDLRGSPNTNYGVYLSGTISNLFMGPMHYVGMQIANYFEIGLTVTNRYGIFNNLPYTPTFKFGGTPITLGNGSILGIYGVNNRQITLNAILNIGSTTVIPSGILNITLPITSVNAGQPYLGSARIYNGAGSFYCGAAEIDGSASVATMQFTGGGNSSDSSPVALASGMNLSIQIAYNF